MQYNLLESHKEFARWLVDQNREGILKESFRLELNGDGRFIVNPSGNTRQDEIKNEPSVTKHTLQALEHERMLILEERPTGRVNPYSSAGYSSVRIYHCGLLQRIFTAVDTNFGELEATSLISDESLGGIGLNTAQFSQILAKEFNLDEMQTVCHKMNITYENLPGVGTREAKARELVLFSQRHGRLLELLIITAKARPKTDWSSLY